MSSILTVAPKMTGEIIPQAGAKPAGSACAQCPGRHTKCVPPEPAAQRPRLAIVGEAPGRNELIEGRPFVGASGRMLERGLRTLGLQRRDVHWTNAVLCDVPPAHIPAARKCCAERLRAELAAVAPEVIVPTGAYALHSVLDLDRRPQIKKWRGSITKTAAGAYVMPTIHPAFVMRIPAWGPVLEADFARVGRVLADGWTAPEDQPGRRIIVAKHLGQLDRLLQLLDHEVAIDVETVGLGPVFTDLVCLAIADQHLSIVVPWTRDLGARDSWWRREEKRAARIISAALRHRVAVTHNGYAFDHIVLARYGIKLRSCEDTLLLAHAAHSHLPKGLDFAVQFYCDVPPWKTFDHAESIEAMWNYNGRDSLYTAMVLPKLREAVAAAKQSEVHAVDLVTGKLCSEMQANGFRIDRRRAEAMAQRLEIREKEIAAECAEMIGREINLLSPIQLREVFFGSGAGSLGAHVCYRSEKTGLASLGVDVMRAYAASANERLSRFASLVLAYRRCRKVRITNLTNPLTALDARSRIHATWMNYGACLPPGTRVLKSDLTWASIESCCVGDELVGFDEALSDTRMRRSQVLSTTRLVKACVTVNTDAGPIVSSIDHLWPVRVLKHKYAGRKRSPRVQWRRADQLIPGDKILRFSSPWEVENSFEAGWIAGMLDGEGCLQTSHGGRGKAGRVVFAQKSGPVAERFKSGLLARGMAFSVRLEKNGVERIDIHVADSIRLLGSIRTTRLLAKSHHLWEGSRPVGKSPHLRAATVTSLVPAPDQEVVALETSTATFVAEGFLSHNCSGRFSSQGPNLMNLPRKGNDPTIVHCRSEASGCGRKCKCDCELCAGVRSIYVARDGWEIVAFDRKQLEMRIAAYASADPVMIAACESSDLHAANAELIFGAEFVNASPDQRAVFRDIAKSSGFAVCYLAEAATVYERIVATGVPVKLRAVEGMLRKLRTKFRRYYEWQSERLEEITATGYVYEPVTGRRRWLGKDPLPTEAANFPIQGGAAGLMNLQLPAVCDEIKRLKIPAIPIAQVHDNGSFEVRKEAVDDFMGAANLVLDQPIVLQGRECTFPSDWKRGERWA